MDKKQERAIKNDIKKGMTQRQICERNGISYYKLKKFLNEKNLKTNGKANNQNAKGHGGFKGNQNAVVTGVYNKLRIECFDENELEIFNSPIDDKITLITDEIKTLSIREYRLLKQIKAVKEEYKEMTASRVFKSDKDGTTIELEGKLVLIERLENALTRVQESKRKAIDSLHKIEIDVANTIEVDEIEEDPLSRSLREEAERIMENETDKV